MNHPASLRDRIINFFGINKNISAMIILVVLVMLGEKMGERFLPLYILAIGGINLAVGFLNAMDNLLSALYSFPGGYLSDELEAALRAAPEVTVMPYNDSPAVMNAVCRAVERAGYHLCEQHP